MENIIYKRKTSIIAFFLITAILFTGIVYSALPAFADESGDSTSSSDSSSKGSSSSDESASALGDISVPSPTDSFYVLDQANVLSEETENKIVDGSNKLNDTYGAQIVVVTVNDVGDNLKDYCYKLFETWKIGGDKQNGLLFLLDVGGDTYYSMAGSGLMDKFTNDALSTMLQTYLEPSFAQKDYSAGVDTLYTEALKETNAYLASIGGSTTSQASSSSKSGDTTKSSGGFTSILKGIGVFILIIILIAALGLVFIYLRGQAQRKKRQQRRLASRSRQRQQDDELPVRDHRESYPEQYSTYSDDEDEDDEKEYSDNTPSHTSYTGYGSSSSKYDFDSFSSKPRSSSRDGEGRHTRRK